MYLENVYCKLQIKNMFYMLIDLKKKNPSCFYVKKYSNLFTYLNIQKHYMNIEH